MVEGPGTTRNSRKASKLINSKVLHISSAHPFHTPWWAGRKLSQIVKVGKELFLVFSLQSQENKAGEEDDADLAIRLHFGMNGSLQVHNRALSSNNTCSTRTQSMHTNFAASQQPTATNYHGDRATLEITFEHKCIRTFQTTISTVISAKAPRAKFARLSTHDVCSPTFTLQNVLNQLNSPNSVIPKDTMISDILLNQNILPGIGNIIKVEGLHEARIHPKRKLSSLSEDELKNVIICCKEYALKWLNTGRAPPKYVYNQTVCGSCAMTSIAICRVGGTNRTTFWCTNCTRTKSTSNMSSNYPGFCSNAISNHSAASNTSTNIGPDTHPRTNDRTVVRKVCSTHGPSTVILRRCKKKGINEQRIFYTCKVRDCNFFHWADTNFPRCKCDKRAVFRVSKTEKTGGKWFYFCSRKGDKSEGCGYFQWAEEKDLRRYGHLLTPLL